MKPIDKEKALYMSAFEVIKYYRPLWNETECTYFMLKNLNTVNPKRIDLIDKCNKILL